MTRKSNPTGWLNAKKIKLVEGEKWLCEWKGEPILLELGCIPNYTDANKPYFYWFEPQHDRLIIEWADITKVVKVPPPSNPKTKHNKLASLVWNN